MKPKEMIKEFQCPGCVCGTDPDDCEKFKLDQDYGSTCSNHVVGTNVLPGGHIVLGLPKGFNKTPIRDDRMGTRNQVNIRMWEEGTHPNWDRLNVPVWAMEQDGFLFVRTYSPRIGDLSVDVVEKGTMDLVPNAINVADFVDEID